MPDVTTPSGEPPDWSSLDEDILCPLCDYNLRGLIEPRCPECGYAATWAELLDPNRKHHPYLFEHHPEANVRSFWQTAVGGLRPRRFWTSLHPVQPSRPRRLILYWALATCMFPIAAAMQILPDVVQQVRDHSLKRIESLQHVRRMARDPRNNATVQRVVNQYGSLEAFVDETNPPKKVLTVFGQSLRSNLSTVGARCLPAVWPWITFAALMVFQISMRRAKIKTMHVLRCVLYASDLFLWVGLLFIVAAMISILLASVMPVADTLLLLIAWGVISWRLYVAYRRYLRFDHPFATVAASQIIVFLIVLNFLVIPMWR